MREVLGRHPWLGAGYGQFQTAVRSSTNEEVKQWYKLRGYELAPDSLYIQLVTESGLLGGAAFAILVIQAYFNGRKKAQEFSIALMGVLIMGLSCEILSNTHSSLLFWLILAGLLGSGSRSRA